MKPKLPELLAPAGDEAAFRCALAGGADAIYCGLDSLNARRGATNFTDESFERCCRLAHVLGVRVYLTLNVVIKESELEQAIRLAERATALGADALIIQDLGLLAAIHELHPEIELHVSTQANVHDARGVLWCGRHGASRVTLSRELSLPEIRDICAAGATEGVGCEVFCHGALCMSYSGLCLMSSLRGKRSANRGLCAQPCRLPHQLLDGEGHALTPEETRALCPKDLSATAELAKLVEAGVASLKIEGRMKAPDYVLSVVGAWRELLDSLEVDDEDDASMPDRALERANHRLKRAFNRDFTTAYLHGRSGPDMMSPERSNNRGSLVGEVVESRGNRVTVLLEEGVGKGDLLELRPPRNPDRFLATESPRDAKAGERLGLELKRPMPVGVPVRVLREAKALSDAKSSGNAEYPRGRQVRIASRALLGEPLEVILMTRTRTPEERAAYGDVVTATATGPVVEPARTKELTASELGEHVDRLGNTPFVAVDADAFAADGVGLSFSTIHKVRAKAVEMLEQALLAPYAERTAVVSNPPSQADLRRTCREPTAAGNGDLRNATDRQTASNPPSQADLRRTCREPTAAGNGDLRNATDRQTASNPPSQADLRRTCREPTAAEQGNLQVRRRSVCDDKRLTQTDGSGIELCCLANAPEVAQAAKEAGATRIYAMPDAFGVGVQLEAAIPWLDEVCREPDHPRIDPLVREGEPCVVSNVSELALAQRRNAAFEVGFDLPIANEATVRLLEGSGARALWLSFELSESELAQVVASATVPCGIVVAGALRAMTTEHCVLQQAGRCTRQCETCEVNAAHPVLENIDGRRLPVTSAPGHRSRIWWDEPVDLVPHLGEIRALGVRRLLVDARLMTPEEASSEVRRVATALAGARPERRPHTTFGHYLQPVD